MMDYARIQNKLLLDFIQNEGPSEEEIDAFHLGLIRFQNAIDSGDLLNEDIPYLKSDVVRLENQVNKLNEELEEKSKLISSLKDQINEATQFNNKLLKMSNPERTQIKKEEEYKHLNKEINNLQSKLSFERNQAEIWMTRYNCLSLKVKMGS
jgi:predicted RNase H-like nuclease (RuvC/YqgF family)